MKKQILFSTLLVALLVTGMAHAASWQESLSSAASELTKESGSTQAGCQPLPSPACWAIAPRV